MRKRDAPFPLSPPLFPPHSYFADLDAARHPPAADAAAAAPSDWTPSAAADAPTLPTATATATAPPPPCDDDDASGALAAMLSVGRTADGESDGGGDRGWGAVAAARPLTAAFTAPPDLGDVLARVAVGDI